MIDFKEDEEKNTTPVICDDGIDIPLQIMKSVNGKYVIINRVYFGMGTCYPGYERYVDEDFDEIVLFPLDSDGAVYFTARKENEVRLYCYMNIAFGKKHGFYVHQKTELLGRELKLISTSTRTTC